jgi:hypothetical protein
MPEDGMQRPSQGMPIGAIRQHDRVGGDTEERREVA